jgi:predicted RNase H-like HicB family nuclease
LSFEQVKELVSLMRSGKTEEEALELIKKWKILYYLS